ncbi:protein tonB [Pseudoxanthomonas putridarboris]|uniref:Protein tonB n=1 Tax=Pseudoxanthomonas putridarboris TaxID=752605 RepID=A0ABU9J4T8_9GAMM
MKQRSWLGAAALVSALVLAQAASAQGAGAVRKQIEVSMLVTGEIAVDAQGRVVDHALDEADELPPGVVAFLQQQVPAWEFRPQQVDGVPVGARNTMRLLLVARKQEDGAYEMRLQAANFDPLSQDEGYSISSKRMVPPRYPDALARAGAAGTVYLILKVGRDGTVQEVFAEQVNLRAVATEPLMEKMRRMFAGSALQAARGWSYTPPSRGELAAADFWTVRVPVEYTMGDAAMPKYGQWVAYIPGPRKTAEWVDAELANSSPEALADGAVGLLDKQALRLLTPLASEG